MAKHEKSIKLGLKGEADSFRVVNAAPIITETPVVPDEKPVRPGRVISRLDHPVLVSYHGESIVIPPKGNLAVADCKKLGALPRGVVSILD